MIPSSHFIAACCTFGQLPWMLYFPQLAGLAKALLAQVLAAAALPHAVSSQTTWRQRSLCWTAFPHAGLPPGACAKHAP